MDINGHASVYHIEFADAGEVVYASSNWPVESEAILRLVRGYHQGVLEDITAYRDP